jgi:ribonuclease PH
MYACYKSLHVLNYRRVLEFAAAIKATFEPVIQTHLYPRSQIDIFVQVLEQDGGNCSLVYVARPNNIS